MRRILLPLALSILLLFIFFKAKYIRDHTVRIVTPGLDPGKHISVSPSTGDPFHPLRLTECTGTTPGYYAPCLARTLPNAVSAEEMIYPAFTISPPIFAVSRPEDAERWWNNTWMLWDRAFKIDGRLRYPEKHGQVYVSLTFFTQKVETHIAGISKCHLICLYTVRPVDHAIMHVQLRSNLPCRTQQQQAHS